MCSWLRHIKPCKWIENTRNLFKGSSVAFERGRGLGKSKDLRPFLEARLGYKIKSIALYEQAMRHRSVGQPHNERLEYLGDAVIELAVSALLFEQYATAEEGLLTVYRQQLTSRTHLNEVAHKMGLEKYVVCAESVRSRSQNLYGNVLEALLGAVYLDKGYAQALQVVQKELVGNFQPQTYAIRDAKSMLYEWAQQHQETVVFEKVRDDYDPLNDRPVFTYRLQVASYQVQAAGNTQKEAQQKAAHQMLKMLPH